MSKAEHPFTKENGWRKIQVIKYRNKFEIYFVKNDEYRQKPEDKPVIGVAWYVFLDGKYYGDWVTIDELHLTQGQTNAQALKDTIILLQDQAHRTIDELKPPKDHGKK